MLQRETEKLRSDIEKMRSELRSVSQTIMLLASAIWIKFILFFSYDTFSESCCLLKQVWNWQSYCWTAFRFESWKRVRKLSINFFLFSVMLLLDSDFVIVPIIFYLLHLSAGAYVMSLPIRMQKPRVSPTSLTKWV